MKQKMLIRNIEHIFKMGKREPILYCVDLEGLDGDTEIARGLTLGSLPSHWEPGAIVWIDENGQPAKQSKPRLTLAGKPIVEVVP